MQRALAVLTCLALVLALSPAVLTAQTPAPGTSTAPAPQPRVSTPPAAAEPATVEGTVRKVDPAVNQIKVGSGPFGLFGRTVEVNNDTAIQIEGRKGTLADIREGAKAKVAYETRDGRNIAKHIDVMAEERADRRTTR